MRAGKHGVEVTCTSGLITITSDRTQEDVLDRRATALCATLSLLLCLFSPSVTAQTAGESECQQQADITKPNDVFRCINPRSLNNPTCRYAQQNWASFISRSYERNPDIVTQLPTCTVIADALRMKSGKSESWSGCILDKTNRPNTESHIKACLINYGFEQAQRWAPLQHSGTCRDYYLLYSGGIAAALPLSVETSTRLRDAAGTIHRQVEQRWAGESPLEYPEIAMTGEGPRIRTLDCVTMARVINSLHGSNPWWASCLGYQPTNDPRHLQSCLRERTRTITECAEGRTAYEDRLKAAYFTLPSNYVPLSCDTFSAMLQSAKDEVTRQTTAAATAKAEAASRLEAQRRANTPPPPSTSMEGTGSFIIIIVVFVVVLGAGLFQLFKPKKPLTSYALSSQKLSYSEADIRALFDKKQGDITYTGKGGGTFLIDLGKDKDGNSKTTRWDFSFHFDLIRSIAAMNHRDREFLRIFLLMNARALIPPSAAEKLHFGLVYGDGQASAHSSDYAPPIKLAQQWNLMELEDGLKWFARQLSITKDSSVSLLMTYFNAARRDNPEDSLVREIDGLLSAGNRWFTADDIPGSDFDPAKGGEGIFIGLLPGTSNAIRYFGEGSLATIAPPGAGKSQCHILPNLFLWRGPAIVLDIKGELWRDTSAYRLANVGPVYRFAPYDYARSHSFNPLSVVRSDGDHVWEDASALAEMMIVPRSTTDPFWEESAQRILTAVIAYVCRRSIGPNDRPISRVLDILSRRADTWTDFLVEAAADEELPPLARVASGFAQMDEKMLASVLSQTTVALKSWDGGERIARTTGRSDWNPENLRESCATIYICINPEHIEMSLSMLRVFIGQHIRALTRRVPAAAEADVLFLLDEFPQLRRMQPVEDGIAIGRGYKIKLWLIAQSLGQVRLAYKNADGMLGQCGLRSFMNVSLQDGSAQKVSEDLGSFDSILDASRQKVVEAQALAGPEYRDLQVVFARSAKPVRLQKVMAYATPPFSSMLGEAPWPPTRPAAQPEA